MDATLTRRQEVLAFAPSLRAAMVLLARIAANSSPSSDASELRAAAQVLPMAIPELDLDAANPYQVRALREALQEVAGVFHGAIHAIGQLMAYSSVDIETGLVSQDSIEALGWMLALMGDGCAFATVLEQRCAVALADFNPPEEMPFGLDPKRGRQPESEVQ
jgi:hypothetical protein